jgi:hypothetical protein
MSRSMRLLLILLCSSLCAFAGCGPKYATGTGVKIKGKIVKGGQPLDVPGRESGSGYVEVNLSPEDETQLATLATTSANADADGNFLIDYEGRGVPPGKYKIAVYQRDLGGDSDMLKGKFAAEKTPIKVDVDQSKVGGVLDLGTIDLDTAK